MSLAKVMRRELKRRGVESLKVVYSKETPIKPREEEVTTCREGCICSNKDRTCLEKRQIQEVFLLFLLLQD